jgi:hypothetical protein
MPCPGHPTESATLIASAFASFAAADSRDVFRCVSELAGALTVPRADPPGVGLFIREQQRDATGFA